MIKSKLLITTAIAGFMQAGLAQAQVANAGDDDNAAQGGLQEIIVTAQKRSQNLQDVPVSIAVLTGDVIEKSGAPRLSDLSTSVPNLQINQDGDASSAMTVTLIFSGSDNTAGTCQQR